MWDESVKGTDPQLLMISRLDTGCAGMCLVARTAEALGQLQVKAREGKLIHTFVALVHGRSPDAWTVANGAKLTLPAEDPNGGGSQRQRRKAKAAERAHRVAVAAAAAAGDPPPPPPELPQQTVAEAVDCLTVQCQSVEDRAGNDSITCALSTVRLSCVSTHALRCVEYKPS